MGNDRREGTLQRRVTEFRLAAGAVAQLGERLPCTQEVSGSIPLGSTIIVGSRSDRVITNERIRW